MTKYTAENERIKRRYFEYQKEAMRKSESTIQGLSIALTRFESYTGYKNFGTFTKEQAIGFKKHLTASLNQREQKPLSKTTIQHTLSAVKEFMVWLSREQGYRRKVHVRDAEYLNYGEKEARAAAAHTPKSPPTLEQVRHAIFAMPSNTDIERRDRALFALAILTGMRDSALVSLRLKHIDTATELVNQDPNMVRTKASKQIFTYFMPVGDDLKAIVNEWVHYLRTVKLYGNDNPVFPRTKVVASAEKGFSAQGIEPVCWSNATPVRRIMREAYERVALPYFHPHLLRKTLVQVGERRCRTPEDFKAWSQNIGHESVMTTFRSYGNVGLERQGELIKNLDGSPIAITPEIIGQVLRATGFSKDS
ncbi:MAG: tyrosine-type recombinase/integrase [Alphaproteobacteria bacterium]|nr:tyrosine-type recombinase/integrase [Alphaproteobacteria bacterium]